MEMICFFYINMLQKVDRNQSSCFFIELDFGFFKWLENVLIKVENWFYWGFYDIFWVFSSKMQVENWVLGSKNSDFDFSIISWLKSKLIDNISYVWIGDMSFIL
jgi:hypothetical protein